MELKFELRNEEYIELNKLLKAMFLVGTGGEANCLISEGEVRVNNEAETRKRRKIRAGDVVEVGNNKIKVVGS